MHINIWYIPTLHYTIRYVCYGWINIKHYSERAIRAIYYDYKNISYIQNNINVRPRCSTNKSRWRIINFHKHFVNQFIYNWFFRKCFHYYYHLIWYLLNISMQHIWYVFVWCIRMETDYKLWNMLNQNVSVHFTIAFRFCDF